MDTHRVGIIHRRKLKPVAQNPPISSALQGNKRAEDVVDASLQADIPLHKLRHPALKQLFSYNNFELPSESSCRIAVPVVHAKYIAWAKEHLSEKKVTVQFKFKRTILYFVLQSYVPATLIVMLSWVSFWVDARSIPARAALSITTVLTMITLTGTVNSQLPKVSNIKALDVYFGMCFFYVFAALIEFSAVCYLDKKSQKAAERSKEEQSLKKAQEEQELKTFALLREVDCLTSHESTSSFGANPGFGARSNGLPYDHLNGGSNAQLMGNQGSSGCYPPGSQKFARRRSEGEYKTPKSPKQPFNVLRVDNYSRVVFPTTFMILNLIYWGVYTNVVNTL